ncbi:MAG: DUF4129 domain-containing protein [Planctomycetaceae bacterium]
MPTLAAVPETNHHRNGSWKIELPLLSGLRCWVARTALLVLISLSGGSVHGQPTIESSLRSRPIAMASSPALSSSLVQDSVFSDAQIQDAAQSVMQENEFRSVRSRILERMDPPELVENDIGFLNDVQQWVLDGIRSVFDAIGDFFTWIIRSIGFRSSTRNNNPGVPVNGALGAGAGLLSQAFTLLAIAAILFILAVIVAMVVKSMDKRKTETGGLIIDGEEDLANLSKPPGELAAATYEGRAVQFAAEGNFRAAIRELLLGSMSWIERSGLIRYRKGLTNRDYVRSVWRRRGKRDAFAITALEFEKIYFGRREATRESFEKCLNAFKGAFREEEQAEAV